MFIMDFPGIEKEPNFPQVEKMMTMVDDKYNTTRPK